MEEILHHYFNDVQSFTMDKLKSEKNYIVQKSKAYRRYRELQHTKFVFKIYLNNLYSIYILILFYFKLKVIQKLIFYFNFVCNKLKINSIF